MGIIQKIQSRGFIGAIAAFKTRYLRARDLSHKETAFKAWLILAEHESSHLMKINAFDVGETLHSWLKGDKQLLSHYLKMLETDIADSKSQRTSLISYCDDIIEGRITVYGTHHTFSSDFEWNIDLLGTRQWPEKYFRRYRLPDRSGRYDDYRHVWELNRQQHLVLLGLAWRLSGNPKYVSAILDHINSWMQQNPCGYTVNWASAMEVSLRLISWMLALTLVREALPSRSQELQTCLKGFILQYRFLEQDLSVDQFDHSGPVRLRNNHTIVELCGFLALSPLMNTLFEISPVQDYERLRDSLIDEINSQTYRDGMHVEQSSSYLRFTLEAIALCGMCDANTGFAAELLKLSNKYYQALEAMNIDGKRFVLVGDEDNGHAVISTPEPQPDDLTEVKRLMSALSNDQQDFTTDGQMPTSALPDSGHWCWRGKLKEFGVVVYFRAGQMDFPNIPGYAPHAQCDLLSFTLFVDGKPVCLDSGTYTYHDAQLRKRLRSGRAHNIFGLAGYEQMRILGPFNATDYAQGKITSSSDSGVTGELTMLRDGNHIHLERSVYVDREAGQIQLCDRIIEGPPGNVEWYLNVHSNVTGDPDSEMHVGPEGYLKISGLNHLVAEESVYSSAYGVIEPSRCLVASQTWDGRKTMEVKWFLTLSRD